MTPALAPALDEPSDFADVAHRAAWWLAAPDGAAAEASPVVVRTSPGLNLQQLTPDERLDPRLALRLARGRVAVSSAASADSHLRACRGLLGSGGTVLATDATTFARLSDAAQSGGLLLNGDENAAPDAALSWLRASASRQPDNHALAPILANMRGLAGRSHRGVVVGGTVSEADVRSLSGEVVALAPDGPLDVVLTIDPALTLLCLHDPVRHLGPSRDAAAVRDNAIQCLTDDQRVAIAVPAAALALMQARLPRPLWARLLTVEMPPRLDSGPDLAIAALGLLVRTVDVVWPGDGLAALSANHAEVHPAFAASARAPADLTPLIDRLDRAGVGVQSLSRSAFPGLSARDRGRAPTTLTRQEGTPWPEEATTRRFVPHGPRRIAMVRRPDAVVPFLAVDQADPAELAGRILSLNLNRPDAPRDAEAEISAVLDALDTVSPRLVLTPEQSIPPTVTSIDDADDHGATLEALHEALQSAGRAPPEGPFEDDTAERKALLAYRALIDGGLAQDHLPRLEALVAREAREAIIVGPHAPVSSLNTNRLAGLTVITVNTPQDALGEAGPQVAQIIPLFSSAVAIRGRQPGPVVAPVTALAHVGPDDIMFDPADFGLRGSPGGIVMAVALARGLGLDVRAVLTGDPDTAAKALDGAGFAAVPVLGANGSRTNVAAFHTMMRGTDWSGTTKVALLVPASADFTLWQDVMEGLGDRLLTVVDDHGEARVLTGDRLVELARPDPNTTPFTAARLADALRAFGADVAVRAVGADPGVLIPLPTVQVVPPSDAADDNAVQTGLLMTSGWPGDGLPANKTDAEIDRLRTRLDRRVRALAGAAGQSPAGALPALPPRQSWLNDLAEPAPRRQAGATPSVAGSERPGALDHSAARPGLATGWLVDRFERTRRMVLSRSPGLSGQQAPPPAEHAGRPFTRPEGLSDTKMVSEQQRRRTSMARKTFRSLWPWPGTILLTLLCAWLIYMGSIADFADVRTAFYGMAFVTAIAVLLGVRYAFIRGPVPSLTPTGAAGGEFESRAATGFQSASPERSRFDAPRRSVTGESDGIGPAAPPPDDGMPRNARMRAAAANSSTVAEADSGMTGDGRSDTVDQGTNHDGGNAKEAEMEGEKVATAPPAEAEPSPQRPAPVREEAPRRNFPDDGGPIDAVSDQIQAALAREKADRGAALAQLNSALSARLDAVDRALDDIKAACAAATNQAVPPDALPTLTAQVERLSAAVGDTASLRDTVAALSKQSEDVTALSERVAAIADQGEAKGATPALDMKAIEKRLEGVITVQGFNNILNTKLLPNIDARIVERIDNAVTPDFIKAKLPDMPRVEGDGTAETALGELRQRLDAVERDGAQKIAAVQRDVQASLGEAKAAISADIQALRDASSSGDGAPQSALKALQAKMDVGDRAVAEIRDGLASLRGAVNDAVSSGRGGDDLRKTLEDLSGRLSAVEAAAASKTIDPVRDAVAVLEARVNSGLSDASGEVNTLRTGLSDLAQYVSQVSDHYAALLQRVDEIGASLATSGAAPGESTVQGEMDTLREQLLTIIEQNREIKAQQQQISETFSHPARIEFGKAN